METTPTTTTAAEYAQSEQSTMLSAAIAALKQGRTDGYATAHTAAHMKIIGDLVFSITTAGEFELVGVHGNRQYLRFSPKETNALYRFWSEIFHTALIDDLDQGSGKSNTPAE